MLYDCPIIRTSFSAVYTARFLSGFVKLHSSLYVYSVYIGNFGVFEVLGLPVCRAINLGKFKTRELISESMLRHACVRFGRFRVCTPDVYLRAQKARLIKRTGFSNQPPLPLQTSSAQYLGAPGQCTLRQRTVCAILAFTDAFPRLPFSFASSLRSS